MENYCLVKGTESKQVGDVIKKVTELYLVKAETCSVAEYSLKELYPETEVSSVVKTEVHAIIGNPEEEMLYKLKVNFFPVDDKVYKETYYVYADSTRSSEKLVKEYLEKELNFKIGSINETKIVEVC